MNNTASHPEVVKLGKDAKKAFARGRHDQKQNRGEHGEYTDLQGWIFLQIGAVENRTDRPRKCRRQDGAYAQHDIRARLGQFETAINREADAGDSQQHTPRIGHCHSDRKSVV